MSRTHLWRITELEDHGENPYRISLSSNGGLSDYTKKMYTQLADIHWMKVDKGEWELQSCAERYRNTVDQELIWALLNVDH